MSPYGEKPPLFYYIVFAFAKTFRCLPARDLNAPGFGFCRAYHLIAFFLITRKTFGLSRSLVSVIILGLTPLFYWQARYLQVDMVFSAALVLALLAFFRFTEDGRTGWYYAFFIMLALAFMAKGPSCGCACRSGNYSLLIRKRNCPSY